MVIGAFLFYFILFVFIFSSPKAKKGSKSLKKFFILPGVFALIMVFLTVIKVYFIYKLLLLLFLGFTFLLSYWQWGKQIRGWLK